MIKIVKISEKLVGIQSVPTMEKMSYFSAAFRVRTAADRVVLESDGISFSGAYDEFEIDAAGDGSLVTPGSAAEAAETLSGFVGNFKSGGSASVHADNTLTGNGKQDNPLSVNIPALGVVEKAKIGAVVRTVDINRGNSSTATGCTVVFDLYNSIEDTVSEVQLQFPIASPSQTGTINAAGYQSIQNMLSDIASLKASGGKWIGQNFPAYADLAAYQIPATANANDYADVIADENHDGHHTRYAIVDNAGTKEFLYLYIIQEQAISIATLDALGVVLSSEGNGKIFVELDGTMSLVGYDAITILLSNMASQMMALQTALNDKVDNVAGKGLSTNDFTNDNKNKLSEILVYAKEGLNIQYGTNRVGIEQQLRDAESGFNAVSYPYWIDSATLTQAGVMSAEDKVKLNSAVTELPVRILTMQYTAAGVLTVTFSRTPASVSVVNAQGAAIAGSWSSAGTTMTFTPTSVGQITAADFSIRCT